MKIIENTCGKVCPLVGGLKSQNDKLVLEGICLRESLELISGFAAELLRDIEELENDLEDQIDANDSLSATCNALRGQKDVSDRRIAKARQALFGIVEGGECC